MMKQKIKIVYQAGYSMGGGHWAYCGYGKTQSEARVALEKRINQAALAFVVGVSINISKRKDQCPLPDGQKLEEWILDFKEDVKNNYNYQEQNFEEEEEEY
jgi:hypothetical protein